MSKKHIKEKRQQGDVKSINKLSGGLHGVLSRAMSNLRLSLTFRIALHYCWQLFCTTLLTCVIVSVIFGSMQFLDMQKTARRICAVQPDDGMSYTQLIIQRNDVSATLTEVPYPSRFTDQCQLIADVAFTPMLLSPTPSLIFPARSAEGYILHITYDLSQSVYMWGWMMLAVVICDLVRMLHFIRTRNRLDKRVLAPIRDMTDMAATLSASNLSNRINLEGTKNELKDLAGVINTMLDRIERSYNSQKQFVSDASHELRTPIAVIQGYTNMLQRWGKDDHEILEEGITAIAQETASMKELVESLLFLARHDKKTLMMEMETFDPCEVISELHREASMVTPEDHFVCSPMESCMIEADRNMIKQVMRILCDNAVKYSPKGGTITMGVESYPGGCTLILSDNGPGIPREELPKIFDRFYRSDSARKSEGGGHGLGLSIARIIIVAHGGKIRVRSKVGEGTTFCVVLPEKQSCLKKATNE
ncbi:MAG: HAMP domain-containing histidine kinase [Clostridia bacterium]|nr:HAMP domain-containing histidine kinase [Clostridia bacterium]